MQTVADIIRILENYDGESKVEFKVKGTPIGVIPSEASLSIESVTEFPKIFEFKDENGVDIRSRYVPESIKEFDVYQKERIEIKIG